MKRPLRLAARGSSSAPHLHSPGTDNLKTASVPSIPPAFQNTKSVKYNFCFLKKSTELKSENNFLVSDPEEISKKKKIRIIRR